MATTEKSGLSRLVIVESPAKARTIEGYLGKGYKVASSIGHIRDLPNRASDVPKEQRAKYGTMGVAIDEDFEPLYLVDTDKKIAGLYDVWRERERDGVKSMGIARSHFVIDEDGKVIDVQYNVQADASPPLSVEVLSN